MMPCWVKAKLFTDDAPQDEIGFGKLNKVLVVYELRLISYVPEPDKLVVILFYWSLNAN